MKVRAAHRSVLTALCCCSIVSLGGWIGSHTSTPVSRDVVDGLYVRHTQTADSFNQNSETSKWDSTEWTGRVVVGEYDTGINCTLCQVHEHAFDSLISRYPSTKFIALAYHYGGNVPISNWYDSTLQRWIGWWGNIPGDAQTKTLDGVIPHAPPNDKGRYLWGDYIDGHARADSVTVSELVKDMSGAIDAELRKAPEAVLHVEATPHRGTIETKVAVSSIAPSHPDVFVRIVVVEDTVLLKVTDTAKYNKHPVRLDHYMVVRAAAFDSRYPFNVLPDSSNVRRGWGAFSKKYTLGILVHGPGTVSYTFDMAKTQAQRLHLRDLALGKVRPRNKIEQRQYNAMQVEGITAFGSREGWTMDPKRLHVVAFLQDAHTGDVLQAQMIRVNTGPKGELLKLP